MTRFFSKGQRVLFVSAYASGVPLTSLIVQYGLRNNLPIVQENLIVRAFDFDDLFLSSAEIRDRKNVIVLNSTPKDISAIVRFDDASQPNHNKKREGATMSRMAEFLQTRYPNVPIFNTVDEQ